MTSATDPANRSHRLRMALRILNVRLRFILLMVVTGLVASQWDNIAAHWERWTRPKGLTQVEDAAFEFYCPMHPSVVRVEPGNCPICGMPLVKRPRGERPELPEGVLGRVQLTPYQIQLAGVGTSEVAYRRLDRRLLTLGTIEVDERRVQHIAARTAGRIEDLHVDFTGEEVRRNAPLAEIYSPDLIVSQQEYLLALRTLEKMGAGAPSRPLQDAQEVLDAARSRLLLWGVTESQIADLVRREKPDARITIFSPANGIVTQKNVLEGQYVMEGTELYTIADLSRVWMTGYAYERDIDRLRVGQEVEVTTESLPGRSFRGKISYLWPILDRPTRTLRFRVDIENPDLALRPGIYVAATVSTESAGSRPAAAATSARYTCPMDPEIVSDEPGSCPICGMRLEKAAPAPEGEVLAIPETAVIDTGSRKVVYLEREPGTFDAVEVELGPLSGGYYPVLKGLTVGERIVTQGAFLVDAEVRLDPGAAGSYFGATGGPSQGEGRPAQQGHVH